MQFRQVSSLLLISLLWFLSPPVAAQQGCPSLASIPAARGANIFTEEQENHLGDAWGEQVERDFRVIEDDAITAYLQQIGERILKQMPASGLRYRFFLTDLPAPTAFAGPGARIYVTRKMVAFSRSEDELAGVIAHEIGHVVTRQLGVQMSARFREVLGVTQVSSRADIFEKYHQMLENYRRKGRAFSRSAREEEKLQLEADQIVALAAARAGYKPEAFAAVFDRLAQVEGKTGNWLSDLFGTTKPEQRRLRELLRSSAALPEVCVATRPANSAEAFEKWKTAVIAYTGLGRKESLHGVLAKRPLDPPLRVDILHLKFSPDGNYALAQDDSSIFVLTRRPLEHLFRIEATEAHPAQFTPDSKFVVFSNAALHVEHWSIEEERRTAAYEVTKPDGCMQTQLSRDGGLLACLDGNFNLSVLDVATSAAVFQKKSFYTLTAFEGFAFLLLRILAGDDEIPFLQMGFSPDNRYLVAARGTTALVLDLTTRSPVSIPLAMKNHLGTGFAFLGPDRVVVLEGKKSALMRFPSGELISKIELSRQAIAGATAGDYLMLRPISDYPVGVMDLNKKEIILAHRRGAMDVYGDVAIGERVGGEVSLYRLSDGQRTESLTLPVSPFGRFRAVALSPDLLWLAVSERNRGAVWNLTSGERVFHTRGFRGAAFAEQGMLYVDFPKFEETPRSLAQMDLRKREIVGAAEVKDRNLAQHGHFLLVQKPAEKDGPLSEDVIYEVRDVRTQQTLWSRHFPKSAPAYYINPHEGVIAFTWRVSSSGAKNEIKSDPELKARFDALKEKEGDRLILVADASSGRTLGKLLVETGKGSFGIEHISAAGDWVGLSDTQNRLLLYSLVSGEMRGRVFGGRFAIAKATGTVCVEANRGRLALYDIATLNKLDEYTFSSPVSLVRFSDDGKRLFVLTANQVAYTIDVSTVARAAAQP
jgi:WD40 repeat protein